jgi:methanogenic corrinoid protein MtbC1
VPLLVLAHRAPDAAAPPSEVIGKAVQLLAEIAVRSDVAEAVRLVEDLHAAGFPLDTLYLEVIAGAARHLGQMWHDDKASFADVTIGVLAMQRLLHALDHAFCAEAVRRDPQRRLLLAARPGEPHGFALDMLSAFLRRAGWDVACLAPRDEQALCAAVRGGWYAVVGISDSCGENADEMAGVIHAVRRASRNRQVRVMVGGSAFSADPERAIRAGADATAADARHAVLQAEGLFALVRNDG